jgi:hypothetical protein
MSVQNLNSGRCFTFYQKSSRFFLFLYSFLLTNRQCHYGQAVAQENRINIELTKAFMLLAIDFFSFLSVAFLNN